MNLKKGEGGEARAADFAVEEKLSELEILRQSLEEAKKREKDIYDQLLRLGAEFDNFRKRSEARLVEARRSGQEDVLLEVIGLCDVLDHAEQSIEKATDLDQLKEGLKLVKHQFEKFLSERGVTLIKSMGEKLDPHLHEALIQEENEDFEEGNVISEIQKGYKFMDRVLRPAKVKVAKKSERKEETSIKNSDLESK